MCSVCARAVRRQQRKFLLAAHKEIHKEGEEIISMNSAPTSAPQPTTDAADSEEPGAADSEKPDAADSEKPDAADSEKPGTADAEKPDTD